MGAATGSVFILMGAETVFVLLVSAMLAGGLLGLSQFLNTTEILLWFSA